LPPDGLSYDGRTCAIYTFSFDYTRRVDSGSKNGAREGDCNSPQRRGGRGGVIPYSLRNCRRLSTLKEREMSAIRLVVQPGEWDGFVFTIMECAMGNGCASGWG
jgi:hypothetical protein